MTNRSARTFALCAALALGLSAAPAVAQTVTHIYELNGSYADTLGGPSLSPNGGTLTATDYQFGANQGLSLSNALVDPADYSIELRFEFDATNGYRRILDFKNLTADQGLYNLDTTLRYFPVTNGPAGAFANNVFADVVLTRDDVTDTVTGYVNGVQQFSFIDGGGDAVFSAANNIIWFFQDDNATGGESSAGTVDRIRIYNGDLSSSQVLALAQGGTPPGLPGSQVPEPGAVALLAGAGVTGLLALRRRIS
jgi:hypothetical protein